MPKFTTLYTTEGVEVACECGELMRFTDHTTVGDILAAKDEHEKAHSAILSLLDEKARLYSLDGASIYLEFMGAGKVQLVVPALNSIAGKAGAWVWKFDCPEENALYLERILQRRCEREQERREQGRLPVEIVRLIPDDPTTEIEVGAGG